jgi:hypothetical protein
MSDIYYQKYLKYKNKYLALKKQIEQKGGMMAVGMPGVGIPGVGMPGMGMPGMGMPGVGMPGMGMSRMMLPYPYGMIYTTLKSKKKDKDEDSKDKKEKTVMAFVPGWGWVLTTVKDDDKDDDDKDDDDKDDKDKTRYFFIPGRGMVAYNSKYNGMFPMVLNYKPYSVMPEHLRD